MTSTTSWMVRMEASSCCFSSCPVLTSSATAISIQSMLSRSRSLTSGASASMSGGVTSSSIRDSMMSRLISNSRSSCLDMHEPPLVELAHLRRQPARRDSLGDPLADLDRPQRPVHLHRELHGAIGHVIPALALQERGRLAGDDHGKERDSAAQRHVSGAS